MTLVALELGLYDRMLVLGHLLRLVINRHGLMHFNVVI